MHAVILAGGFGKRLLSLHIGTPKPLVPIGGEIHYRSRNPPTVLARFPPHSRSR
jgi:hypothetical protein